MSVEYDLLGQEVKHDQPKKKHAPLPPAPVARKEEASVPYRPYTVKRLSKTVCMIINDDCADRLK